MAPTSRSLFLLGLAFAATVGSADAQACVTPVANALRNFTGASIFGNTILQLVPGSTLTSILSAPAGATILLPSDVAAGKLLTALNLPQSMFAAALNNPTINGTILSVLTYHVIPAQVNASAVTNATNTIPTYLPGANLSSTVRPSGTVTFSAPFTPVSTVTSANVFAPGCSTATIHVIDTVLLPVDPAPLISAVAAFVASMTPPPAPACVTAVASALGNFAGAQTMASAIAQLVDVPTLTAILTNPAGATILLPSDAAANGLMTALNIPSSMFTAVITNPAVAPTILTVLKTHVIPAQVNSSGVPANAVNSIPTYNSAVNLSSTVANGFVTFRTAFSSANVTRADVFAPGCSTATIHVINAVLLPIDPTPLVGPVAALVASMTPPPAARPNPPPPVSSAATYGNMVLLALVAMVSAMAVAW